jgi:hypothetical protein
MDIINQNPLLFFISTVIIIALLIFFKIYKFKKLIDADMRYRRFENGQLVQEGYPRHIWDYNFFPGISRLWHASEWQQALSIFTLIIIILIYLYSNDEKLINLIGINFGVVIGMSLRSAR